MSEIGEAIGTLAEGGLLAKAVSKTNAKEKRPRQKGERSLVTTDIVKGHFAEKACLNCGTELIGAHCHSCGQKAHLHRTIGAFVHDILHGALHFDGKTWRTLPNLVFKPGKLTRRYIDGERARFVSPIALFLFSVFLMYAVFQAAGFTPPTQLNTERIVNVGLEKIEDETRIDIEKAQAELEQLAPDDPDRERLEQTIDDAQIVLTRLANTRETGSVGQGLSKISVSGTGIDWIDDGMIKKWTENPGLMLYKLQANGYKFSWLLIPLSVPFVWLTFAWRRRFKTYDHAIFVTYSLSFMSLLFVGLSLANLGGVGAGSIIALFTIIAPLHVYKHLKHTYQLSRFSAVWRLIVMTVFIVIILTLFFQALLILGAF